MGDPFKEQTPEEQAQEVERLIDGYAKGRGIDEFRVVCDETNNPQETIDQGQLNVDIFIPVDWVLRRVNDPDTDPHNRLELLDMLEDQGFLNILPKTA